MFSRFRKFPHCLCLLSVLVAPFAIGCDEDHPSNERDDCLTFVDDEMKTYALDQRYYGGPDDPGVLPARSYWDQNHDHCIDPEEAAAVTSIDSATNVRLSSLDDLNQFPNLTTIRKDAFLSTGSVESLHLEHVEVLEASAFENCGVKSVDLPKATYIGAEAFKGCRRIKSVSLPAVQTVENSAFEECASLTTISELNIKRIEGKTFYATGLKSVYQPHVELVSTEAFAYCSELTSVELPNATTIGDKAFLACFHLATVNLPKAAVIGKMAFVSSQIQNLELPNATEIENEAFCNIEELTSVKLPKAKVLGDSIFLDSNSLEHLELTTPDDIKLGKTIVSHSEQVDLVLHRNKGAGGSGKPRVTDATHWAGYAWKSITFVD